MRILVVDAVDSFVYILRQYLVSAGADPTVLRSREVDAGRVRAMRPDAVLLGPGPGHPAASGHVELVHELAGEVPILGVCLGHQAVGLAFGATVVPAQHLMHGRTSRIGHDRRRLFAGMPDDFDATRYHSLVVVEETVPECLQVTARSRDDGYVMGLRHRSLPIDTVQFHPESIRTQGGMRMMRNFLALAANSPAVWSPAAPAAA